MWDQFEGSADEDQHSDSTTMSVYVCYDEDLWGPRALFGAFDWVSIDSLGREALAAA